MDLPLWQKLLLGALALLVVFLFFPGVKQAFKMSEEAPKDWPAVLVPLGLVVLFVILLISLV